MYCTSSLYVCFHGITTRGVIYGLAKSNWEVRFIVPWRTVQYGWYISVRQGTNTGGTLVCSHVLCVGTLGMARYSLVYIIL